MVLEFQFEHLNTPNKLLFLPVEGHDFQVDGITGATYSSKGMNNAVETAVNAYSKLKEEQGNG